MTHQPNQPANPATEAERSLRREVVFHPAWDKRNADPKRDYGIHCVDMQMNLYGPAGVVQFVMFTGWDLPHVAEEMEKRGRPYRAPTPAQLGYHSKMPIYEGQESQSDCKLIGTCYSDCSFTAADKIYEVLVREGSDGVWRALEAYYNETFAAMSITKEPRT